MITREQLKLIIETIDVDWINEHDIDTYELISKLCSEMSIMMDKLDFQLELLKGFDVVMKKLNKENKKLHKELNTKNK